MKSLGARLTLYYAATATATAAALFIAGYLLLESRLIHGLDQLNTSEFRQLQIRLGRDPKTLTPRMINERIREATDAASALFFVNVDEPHTGMVFYSHNLDHHSIPDVKGRHVFDTALPLVGDVRVGEFVMPPFDVSIATPMTQVHEGMRNYVEVCAALLLLMLLLSVAIGVGFSRVILKPLNFISDTANRIRSDNLSERIPLPKHQDELTDLTLLLNQMFDRLEESFNQIKRFSADASHELKTPLSLIRLHGEKMLEDETLSSASVDAIFVQLEEVARLNQIIEEMLFLSRADANAVTLKLAPASPDKFMLGFEQDALVLAEHNQKKFLLDSVGQGIVLFEERWLRQVWLNLLTNAINVTPQNGSVSMTSTFDNQTWQVVFEDEGPGLPDIELAQVFDRFTQFGSAEHRAKGSGLGLAISRSIVALHGGSIHATNRSDRSGLRVTVILPVEKN